MKAYRAHADYCETHEVVFAENASKARSLAFGLDGLQDVEFIEIRINRAKEFDRFYDGERCYLNWMNIDVQRAARREGWWISDCWSTCDCCGLYVFDDLPESQLELTDDGELCLECRNLEE